MYGAYCKDFSRLRRGDFRYTKMFLNSILLLNLFRASGEAISGALRHVSERFLMYSFSMCSPPAENILSFDVR